MPRRAVGQDQDIARYLRSQRKQVLLAVNKAEGHGANHRCWASSTNWASASPPSSRRTQGVRSLLEAALEGFGARGGRGRRGTPTPIRLAVAGRPNVGKAPSSTPGWAKERLVAFDQPGTTRDAIHVPFEREGRRFELIDTAGLRRRGGCSRPSRSSRS